MASLATSRKLSAAAASTTIVKLSPPSSATGIFNLRRMKERSGWRPREQTDPDFWILPREGLGKNYELNWAVNGYRMTPKGEAFRNLHTSGLLMKANTKIDGNRAAHISLGPSTTTTYYHVGTKNVKLPSTAKTLSTPQFNDIFKEVRKTLSRVDELYVHDGAIGSDPSVEQKSRFFTNSPLVALFFRNVLSLTPLTRYSVKDFPHSLTCFVCTIPIGDPTGYSVIDLESNRLLVVGPQSSATLRTAIAGLASAGALTSGNLVLPSYSVTLRNGTTTSTHLLVGPQELLERVVDSASLFGAHHHVLSSSGVARVWDGATILSANTQKGDLVESAAKTSYVTRRLSTIHSNSAKLASIFFLNHAKSGTKPSSNKIPVAEAAQSLVENFGDQFPGDGESFKTIFTGLVQAQQLNEKITSVQVGGEEKSLRFLS